MRLTLIVARIVACCVAMTALSVASTSFADDHAAVDDVVLRSGEHVRGSVLELVPKDHVTILTDAGPRRIEWADVDRVLVSVPASPSPSPYTIPSAGPSPAPREAQPLPEKPKEKEKEPESGPRVHVHVKTPKPVVLYRRAPGSTGWQLICSAPCDKEVPVSGTYRVVGNGVAAKELVLPASDGDTVDITVDPSSTTGLALGGVAIGLGVVIAYGEALKAGGDNGMSSHADRTMAGGIAATALGAAVVGVVVVIMSVGTDVGTTVRRWPGSPASPPPALDAFLRTPDWRITPAAEREPSSTFPVLLQRAF
jgi:hypothetical protein